MLVPLALSFALEAVQLTEAPPAKLTVVVTCAFLNPEQAASVEARLQADWLAEGSPGGQLTLSCPDDRAVAHFEGTGQPVDVGEHRAPDQPIDALLRVAYQVGTAVHAPDGASDAGPAREPPAPEPPSPEPSSPAPPPSTSKVPRTAPPPTAEEQPPSPTRQSREPRAKVTLDVGGVAEHWGHPPGGTVGLDFGLEGQLSEDFALRGKVTLASGWGLPDQLDVKSLTPGILLAKTIVPEWLALRAGPTFSIMSFSGDTLRPRRVTSTSFAAEVEAVLTPPIGEPRPWLSLGLRYYAHDRQIIIVEDEEQLRVPRLAALLGLGVRI